MSDLIQRLERATNGEFHEDYSAQDYLSLCHEALAALKTSEEGGRMSRTTHLASGAVRP